jgi:hypothetical protein
VRAISSSFSQVGCAMRFFLHFFCAIRTSYAKKRKCYVLVTCKTATIFQTVIKKHSYLLEVALSGDTTPSREPAMVETVDSSSARKPEPVSRARRHPMILRLSSLGVASVLSLLLINAVVPPIVADQSDRAVVNAPVTLLTAPIDGEIDSLTMSPGHAAEAGDALARISNVRLDRGTLISLQEKAGDAREKIGIHAGKKDLGPRLSEIARCRDRGPDRTTQGITSIADRRIACAGGRIRLLELSKEGVG